MKEATKPSRKSFIVSDLGALFSLLRTRWMNIFLYGFAFAFVAFTAYLAFCPPTLTPSPWFNNLFASASASTAPYRSQLSSIFSYIFPNSSTSPPYPGNAAPFQPNLPPNVGGSQKGGTLMGNLTSIGDAAPAGEVSGMNMTENGALLSKQGDSTAKKQTVTGVGFQGSGFTEKNKTGNGAGPVQGVDSKLNQTTKGGKGGSMAEQAKDRDDSSKAKVVASKNQTLSGEPSTNDSASAVVPSKGIDLPTKNQTKVEDASKGEATPTAKNMSVVATPPKNQSVTRVDSTKNGDNQAASKGTQTPTSSKEVKSSKEIKSSTQKNGAAETNKSSGVRSSTNSTATTPPTKTDNKGAPTLSASFLKGNGSAVSGGGNKQVDWISAMKDCDIFQGDWVKDDSYPLYPAGSCPHVDEPFDCYRNGRLERAYEKLRWQPSGCNIPRLNATDMLERLRGKRLVFVGDSLNRNMWESLVCVLRSSVKDKKRVFEASGKHEFRTEGSYSFIFKDFNCSVEYFRSPFLVQESEVPESNGKKKETLKLDMIERSSSKYKNADVILFNTGHWWTHEKTSKGKDYYQEGNHIYSELNVVEAFHKALSTWAKWVDTNVNPNKSLVFFRGYSASHFSGGQWNSGGQCDKETEPIKNKKYLSSYPSKMMVLESVIKGMKTPVSYLNITRMTDYRKDAHPSIYRKQNLTEEERRSPERFQDCSHWCLPGVPDSWNEVLYAQLISKQHQML